MGFRGGAPRRWGGACAGAVLPGSRPPALLGTLPGVCGCGGRWRLCTLGVGSPAPGPRSAPPVFLGFPGVRDTLRVSQARGWAGLLAHCCPGRKDIGVHK